MTPELLNKLKHLANIAAHLPHDVALEDEDAAMKALHGELAADTVLQMIALVERALLAAAPNPAVALEPWAPSEEQFEQWRARHGLHHSHNEAFYDAASLYLEATPPALAGSQVQAAGDVLAERERQKQQEGWTPERDDKYIDCELARAAATYSLCTDPEQIKVCGAPVWPWPIYWWKPTTYRRNLVKAGALILAEIERLDRAAIQAQKDGHGSNA